MQFKDAIFIRHNMTSTPKIVEQLWEERLIALHFGDNTSITPADYEKRGKKPLQMLLDYCASGVLMGAVIEKRVAKIQC